MSHLLRYSNPFLFVGIPADSSRSSYQKEVSPLVIEVILVFSLIHFHDPSYIQAYLLCKC